MSNRVTSTVKSYTLGVTVYHKDTKTLESEKLIVTHYNEKTALKSYRKLLENENTSVLKIQLVSEKESTYSVDYTVFAENAVASDSIKLGWINRAVKGYNVKALCYDSETLELKELTCIVDDPKLESVRKELETDSTTVADIVSAEKVSGFLSMNPKKFMDLGTEIERAKK